MSEQKLTSDDLDVLCAALEAWESKDFGAEIMGDVIGMMLTDKKDPVAKLTFDAEVQKQREQRDRERRVRKERSVLLRAKLLTIRNERSVQRLESAMSAGAVDPHDGGTRE